MLHKADEKSYYQTANELKKKKLKSHNGQF